MEDNKKVDTSELLKKVRKIEIKTRGLSNNIFAGEYHTAFKGRGMQFAEVREYMPGDDVRSIDWNVTARYSKPFIKVFEEEREMTLMLLVDVSGSDDFGTAEQTKREYLTEVAATIAFSAATNNDKIGVIFFSDKIEKYIPPQKGKKHILYIIRELLSFQPTSRKTNIDFALKYFTNMVKKRCSAFLISDFIDDSNYSDSLLIASKKHDLAALQIFDPREKELPDAGLIKMKDAETNEDMWVDTSSASTRRVYEQYVKERDELLAQSFAKSGVDYISIATTDDYVKSLMKLFKKRA
ncbi:MAG: DUF58 domain-containing protein [Paludibacteraceae bacterium]|jgi:uncharacterized protein (DUF58 family)|nr:DUF58 domain-containing protein [Paludibacteraceae bacterium]MDD5997686.1 DUF58 domain-containing protein [Bacteroidales bacterium]MBQ6562065.1 DUF58 domain-containing protein [Paludibacteraceae bacterium]MBQ8020416.1 DUF58 domain-containing protein [Paludibacteraceae bacterium]MCR5246389.1 DUF58 domain-containing protein [Paludibacteraceae bacterium]